MEFAGLWFVLVAQFVVVAMIAVAVVRFALRPTNARIDELTRLVERRLPPER